MRLTRREVISGGAGTIAMLVPARASAQANAVTPEHFGAVGDGRTNDTDAFAAMAAFVTAHGGGDIALRKTTYLVGRDERPVTEPLPIMHFRGCERSLTISGNGARLRCAPSLLFGAFDPVTGNPSDRPAPNYRLSERSSPYSAMILAEECAGQVDIDDLELDGRLAELRIGGHYGGPGWQIPAIGIHLLNNRGVERLSDIHAHHHALDGILVDGVDGRSAASTLRGVRSEYNGRQGCSVTGGWNYRFEDCSFGHNGKGGLLSPPGAGVDIEAEGGKKVRNLQFSGCRFADNAGVGLVAEVGDSEGATFDNCTFVGTTSWAAWPNRPAFRFRDCLFVGPIVHAFGDADPTRACQFSRCRFRDDPALAGGDPVCAGPVVSLDRTLNVLFDHCDFTMTHRGLLPWVTPDTIFADCTMSQRDPGLAYPRGTFVGYNVITGNVDLYNARFKGVVIVNGRRMGAA